MSSLDISVENVGGIDSLELHIDDGVTVISGENASNKSSLLQALLFAFGASSVPIRTDADRARVKIGYGDEKLTRTATRTSNGISVSGEGWVNEDDRLLLERFCGLDETNPLRTAFVQNADIEALLKEPMDIDMIERKQAEKLSEKRDLQRELEELSDIDEQLTSRRQELREERDRIESLETRLEKLYEEQNEVTENDELIELREQRADLTTDRRKHNDQVDKLESAIDRLEARRMDEREALEKATEKTKQYNVSKLKGRRENLTSELEEITDRIEVLQSVLTANQEMLTSEYTGALGHDVGLDEDVITCWTCGSERPSSAFEETLEEVKGLLEEDKQRKADRAPEIDNLEEKIATATDARRQVKEHEAQLRSIEEKLESRRESLEQRHDQLSTVKEQIDEVDNEIDALESEQFDSQSDMSDEIEETRVELRTQEQEVSRLEQQCEKLEEQQEKRETLEEHIDELSEEIQRLTEKIENQEQYLREEFNEAMDDLISMLEFENIERVWLDGNFELVIARNVGGNVREDSHEHLAESEREMIGLVLGLAGYVAYDVEEIAPLVVLDSLGAFDTERTRRLINYFGERTELFLAAVHPQKGKELDYETVSFDMEAATY